jgi:hypothetical protein
MSEIDRLMEKWAKDYSDDEVDSIIAYVRKQLASYDAGIKPKRAEAEQVDMSTIVANITKRKNVEPTKPAAPAKGGIRRRV